MTDEERIEKEYFEWMYKLVVNDRYSRTSSYRKLMRALDETEFYYDIPMDGNRFEDGIDLRYKFGRKKGYEDGEIAVALDYRPCSVLEMMIALSLRCEDQIMTDPDRGNRVGQWFWEMVVSLGLGGMNDLNFDERYFDKVMTRFLNRTYKKNGEGGLFTISDRSKDMRTTEIWYQMHWYLREISE